MFGQLREGATSDNLAFRILNDIFFRFNDRIKKGNRIYNEQPVLALLKAERHPRADENE